MKTKISISTFALYGTLVLLALAYLLPAYLTLTTALKLPADISKPLQFFRSIQPVAP